MIETKVKDTTEITYTIVPSEVKVEDLFYYITNELSFEKVLSLYIMLRTAISTGKLGSDKEWVKNI